MSPLKSWLLEKPQPRVELARLVVDRDLLLVLGGGDLRELEIVAHGTISTVASLAKPRPTWALTCQTANVR